MSAKIAILILNFICVIKCLGVGISYNTNRTSLTGKIVRGEFSSIINFPHSAFVAINCENRFSTCGASILNQAILLTAAHCISKCTEECNIKAYFGSERKSTGYERNVISFKIHEHYNTDTKAYDIALMRLEKDLQFSKKVKRVIIMKKPPKYDIAEIAGWGWIDSKGTKSEMLKHAKQQVFSRSVCYDKVRVIPVGTFCATDLNGYPEKGDSGSALMIRGSIQIGIVSFKKRQYTNETIVYTDVSYYYDWILKNARELYCHEIKKMGKKLIEKMDKKWEETRLIQKIWRKGEDDFMNCIFI
ncbi:hypodermin-B-like [Cydia pomonella]|uniref:hypodermin-B-like n=1 Tax=Cydia pomonella TaxID=82600 RepID=UPI002ADD3883|nr:hypodermin-B-like [Cydia pomonella]